MLIESGKESFMKRLWMIAASGLMLFAASAQAQQPITATGTDLFAGPGEDYPPVVELGGGYPLEIYGCVGGYTWCDVSYGEYRGWIDGRDIEYPYQDEQVPLYLYGYELGLPIVSFSIDSYWGSYYHDRPFYSERPYWEHHVGPPPDRWDGPRPDWNSEQRDRYDHFVQERRSNGRDPRFYGRPDGRDNAPQYHQQDGRYQQDQQRQLQQRQQDVQQQQRQQQMQQRQQQDQQRQQIQQRQQQDQQRQQQAQQQRQQQDQQRQQFQQQRPMQQPLRPQPQMQQRPAPQPQREGRPPEEHEHR
jgi:uncharacterized protein YraI